MTSSAPLIGITTDIVGHPEEEGQPAYAARRNYVDAIARAGGLAVLLPYDADRAPDYLARIDGLLVTVGRFDIPSQWYGGAAKASAVLKHDRSLAERALIAAALVLDMPVLGVCNGMQLLGVMHGATMIEHIPDEVRDALDHMAPAQPGKGHHAVAFEPRSALIDIVGVQSTRVNSVHHQAVRSAPGFRIAATAADGVIEAIEIPGCRFCYGVQWHPEYRVSAADAAILEAFVWAAAAYRGDSPPASAS
jgi:putative glutamine amidotransferase